MKKSILLGTAALAAVAIAAPQAVQAAETKIGGYYMFNMVNTQNAPAATANMENANYMVHRLQLNMDFKASDKSHAHMVVRPVDSGVLSGADSQRNVGTAATDANWQVRQLWLETEAWGVGVKVGDMPVALNDGILADNDTTGFGTILLSKNIGGHTIIGALNKVVEGATTAGTLADSKDLDLWILSALGKLGKVNYQLTAALINEQNGLVAAGAQPGLGLAGNGLGNKLNSGTLNDYWLALTLGGNAGPVELTGTAILETGMSNVVKGTQLESSGTLFALRAKGKTGFGGWNGYAFRASKNFTSPNPGGNQPHWSATWDTGGPGAQDLMEAALTGAPTDGSFTATGFAANTRIATDSSNMYGFGLGVNVKAGAWTINPSLDFAGLTNDTVLSSNGLSTVRSNYDHAWGGTLVLSTKLQEATTLALQGTFVDPHLTAGGVAAGVTDETMHYLSANIKMAF
ncbi:MAG: hypothetical protein HQL96_16305 [Magnetococcales bacterium]|nr:hypothetical protein [Magnetococcales bacterium]